MNVHATVTSARSQCETDAEATPSQRLSGATISLSCPRTPEPPETIVVGLTNRHGELSVDESTMGRAVHDDCEIVVQAPSYRVRRYKIGDVCAEYNGNRCVRVNVVAEVVRDLPCGV
jgi:hypothetical protein